MTGKDSFSYELVGQPPHAAVMSFSRPTLVDYEEVEKIGEALLAFQQEYPKLDLIASFRGVQAASSAMLGKLITLNRRATRAGSRLVLVDLESAVNEMFTSSRLDDYFAILPNPDSAFAWLKSVPRADS